MSTQADQRQGTWQRVAWCFVFFLIAIFLSVSVISDGYEAEEGMGRPIDFVGMAEVPNLFGVPGAITAGILAITLGDGAYLFALLFYLWALKFFFGGFHGGVATRIVGAILILSATSLAFQTMWEQGSSNPHAGGAVGNFLLATFRQYEISSLWGGLLCFSVALLGLLLSVDLNMTTIIGYFFSALLGIGKLCLWLLIKVWRLFGWFFQNPSKPKITKAGAPTEEDLQPIDALSSELPEAAFNPEDEKEKVSLLTRVKRACLPQITRREGVPVTGDEGAAVFPDPDIPGAALEEPTEETLQPEPKPEIEPETPLKPLSISLPELPHDEEETVEESVQDAAPFGAIPILEEKPVEKKVAAPSENGQPDPLIEETAAEEIVEDEKAELPDSPAPAVADPPAAAALAAVSTQEEEEEEAAAPVLRRRHVDDDEVPEGYKYPATYTSPPLDIFHKASPRMIPNLRTKLGEMAQQLEETLRTFGLETTVTDITRGPTITRFELEPAPGIKVNRFSTLVDDIALALKARGVRVEAPIPGKKRVGVEISNEEQDPVALRELLEHPSFSNGRHALKLALGKDVAGEVCIADLAPMPHLLVAGATGSGKTVCIKSILAGMLYHHTPDELQLILIDPKMVELSIFNDIPHLITPVVTACDKAAGALGWLISEMEERYHLFKDLRVRNIEVYNESVENGEIEMSGGGNNGKSSSLQVVRKLPYIVCIIDELADLMMLARAEVEDAIARLAQLARAVGIHLIIATQRPSVDVLTGVIKANFPARISFRVSSRVDSRCILDEMGAERLIGKGDMLFVGGHFQQMRLQGAFVSDEEMAALIAYLKRQAPPQYRDEIESYGKSKSTLQDLEDQEDPLLEDAIRVVLDTGQASISMVQRRLRVGYTRAARLVDMMELKGIVGPHTGSKARDILVDKPNKEEYHEG